MRTCGNPRHWLCNRGVCQRMQTDLPHTFAGTADCKRRLGFRPRVRLQNRHPKPKSLTPGAGDRDALPTRNTIFSDTYRRTYRRECEWGAAMPKIRPRTARKLKHAAINRIPGRPAKPSPKLSAGSRRVSAEIGEIVRKRAEAE